MLLLESFNFLQYKIWSHSHKCKYEFSIGTEERSGPQSFLVEEKGWQDVLKKGKLKTKPKPTYIPKPEYKVDIQ